MKYLLIAILLGLPIDIAAADPAYPFEGQEAAMADFIIKAVLQKGSEQEKKRLFENLKLPPYKADGSKRTCRNKERALVTGMVRWLQNSGFAPFPKFKAIDPYNAPYYVLDIHTRGHSHEIYAAPMTIEFVNDLNKLVRKILDAKSWPIPMGLGSLTTQYQPIKDSWDNHCTHASGFAIDIFHLPGDMVTGYAGPFYDLEMNHDLILALVQDERVQRIYFNDPLLLGERSTRRWLRHKEPYEDIMAEVKRREQKGPAQPMRPVEFTKVKDGKLRPHDRHIHIELYMPPGLEELAKAMIEKLSVTKVPAELLPKKRSHRSRRHR